MRRTLLLAVAVLVVFAQISAVGAAVQEQEALTNEGVIKMVQAEPALGEDLIVRAIQSAALRNFDLSADGLIALKQAGVSDAIINAMFGEAPGEDNGGSSPIADDGSTEAIAAGDYVLEREGVYYLQNGELVYMEGVAPGIETGGGSAIASRLTFGIRKAKTYGAIRGAHALLRIREPIPRFVVWVPEGVAIRDLVLVDLEEQDDERKFTIASSRPAVGSLNIELEYDEVVDTRFEQIAPQVYEIWPTADLRSGEYALVDVRGTSFAVRAYDFGVSR